MSKTPLSDLTVLAAVWLPPPSLDPTAVLGCSSGHYPWDEWEQWTLAQGLDPQVARKARELIREAFQHQWSEELRRVCGWNDDGRALLEFALNSPQEALRQWEILMRTDGLRGDYRSGRWTWGYLQADAARLLRQLTTEN